MAKCNRTAGGGKHYTFDSEREVYLSDYPFEIRLDTIIGKARLLPGFLDSGRKDDLVFNQYYKHVEKTVHHLTPPKVGRSEDLTKVLTLCRSIALRMQPVRKYLLTDILMLFLQRAFRMFFRATFCAYPLSDTLCDILHHALGNSTAVTFNNSFVIILCLGSGTQGMVSGHGHLLKVAINAWCLNKEMVDKPTVLTVKLPCNLDGFLTSCSDELLRTAL